MLVQLKKEADSVGTSPADIIDSLWTVPSAEIADEDSEVLTIHLDGKTISFRVPSFFTVILDSIAPKMGMSRSRFIYESLWDYCLPNWLALAQSTEDERAGSLKIVVDNMKAQNQEVKYSQEAIRTMDGRLDQTSSYIQSAEPAAWKKAADDLLKLIDTIDSLRDIYWRKRLASEIVKNAPRMTTILEVLRLNDVPGYERIAEAVEQWQREAIG